VNLRRVAVGTGVAWIALTLLSDWFVSTAPGTALVFGLIGLAGLAAIVGGFFYVFRD
jgi:hypothetical protein